MVATACLLAGGCGSAGSDDDGGDAASDVASTDAGETASDGSSGVDATSTGADTGADACVPEVGDVSLAVTGLDATMWFEAPCMVAALEPGADEDAIAFDCETETELVMVRVAFGNEVVAMPNSLVIGDRIDLAYAVASNETPGQWLTVRDQDDQRTVIAAAIGASVQPSVGGAPADLFDPIGIGPFGGVCEPGPGTCFALGEPAMLRFMLDNDATEVAPFSSGTLAGYTIHAGSSWLADADSEYGCDGQTDTRVAFILVGG